MDGFDGYYVALSPIMMVRKERTLGKETLIWEVYAYFFVSMIVGGRVGCLIFEGLRTGWKGRFLKVFLAGRY